MKRILVAGVAVLCMAALVWAAVVSVFPLVLDSNATLTQVKNGDTYIAQFHNNLKDAIIALETKVGIDGSNDQNSLDYKTRHLLDQGGAFFNANAYFSLTDLLGAVPNKRGKFVFPAGTFTFTSSLKWTQVPASDARGPGFILSGAGVENTILEYAGSDWAFVFNDGTGSGDVEHCIVEHMTIKIDSPARGAFLFNDATGMCQFNDVVIVGYGTSVGVGVDMVGQRSCNCHNEFSGVSFRNLATGVILSGFANANEFHSNACATVGKCMDFSAHGANAVCSSSGQPFLCCTGNGTGSSAGLCAADTKGGQMNLVERLEVDGGTALGINLASDADFNAFVKCATDGATASMAASTGVDNTIIVGCSLSPAPVMTGTSATTTLWLGTSPTTGLVNGRIIALGSTVLTDNGASILDLPTNFRVAGTLFGLNGGNLLLGAGGPTGAIQQRANDGSTMFTCVSSGGVGDCRAFGTFQSDGATALGGAAGSQKVVCVKSNGKIGVCSTVVAADGTCTCG